MSSKPITGVRIEQRARGDYILRTSTGVRCLGSKPPVQPHTETSSEINEEAFRNLKTTPPYSYVAPKNRKPKRHHYKLTDDQIKYYIDQHNNYGKSWLILSYELPCSETVLREICTQWCEDNDPKEAAKLRRRPARIKVNEDALVADYRAGARLKDIGRKYHICDSRVYSILRKRGMVL